VGSPEPERPSGQVQGPYGSLRELNTNDYQKRNETNELFIPPGPRLGDKVVEVANLCKSYGDRQLIDDLSFSIPKGAIVGIIGPNGAGKSTLFRMMSGQEQPDSGSITRVTPWCWPRGSVPRQHERQEDGVREVADGQDILRIGNYEFPSRAYIGRFNFKGSDQQKRVGELSGGERGRLHLAKLLQTGGNVLLLDEPTNDLDIETLRALENACWSSPVVPWSSPTTAGSSTASPPTSSTTRTRARSFFEAPNTKSGRRRPTVPRASSRAAPKYSASPSKASNSRAARHGRHKGSREPLHLF
jgi:energy-coupling factor transporter ATP-binding protein EcfA2